IGKCDEEGNLVGKGADRTVSDPLSIASKSFGQYYLLMSIARSAGFVDALERAFGTENGRIMACFFVNRAVRPGPPAMGVEMLKECFLPEMMGVDLKDWSPLRKMLINLGAAFNDRYSLFRELADGGDAVIYELMSLAESFTPLETVRGDVGYGFSGLPKFKVNLGFSGDRCFSFVFTTAEQRDSDAMPAIAADMQGLGMRGTEFFLRPREFRERELADIMSTGLRFTAQVIPDSALGRRLMAESSKALKGPLDTYVYRGSVYRVYEKREDAGGGSVRLLVFINEKRRNDEVLALYSRLDELERAVSSVAWSDSAKREETRTLYSDVLGMFDISEGEDGMSRAERRRKAVSAVENKCGKMVVMTTTDRPWNELLEMVARHNESEFYIRQFRLDLEEGARFFPSIIEGNGSFVQEFMAIALRDELETRLAASTIGNRVSSMEAIAEMSRLKVTRINGKWVLNEITPLQRTLMTELGVDIPTSRTVNG
ncbi:MAG: hypothetical protein Q4Q58_05195, partial [Thermoplasmata archaeon]|nr:hypothetical protein [Thermoplasmata archaeon]